uniref:Uncharacterized protein n=1 Tax=Trichuris muris TaxID=70415 RepID=A0A5S6QI75_TRIMR
MEELNLLNRFVGTNFEMATKFLILAAAAFCPIAQAFLLNRAKSVDIVEATKGALHRADWKNREPFWRRVVDLLSVEKNKNSHETTFSAIYTNCTITSYPEFVFEDFTKHPRLEQAHMKMINDGNECRPLTGAPMLLCHVTCQIPCTLAKAVVECEQLIDTEV